MELADEIYLECFNGCGSEATCDEQCTTEWENNVANCPCNQNCPGILFLIQCTIIAMLFDVCGGGFLQ